MSSLIGFVIAVALAWALMVYFDDDDDDFGPDDDNLIYT